MSRTQPNPEIKKTKVIWFAFVVVIILTISILWLLKPKASNADAAPATASSLPTPVTANTPSPTMVANLNAQQTAAVTAATHATNAKPIVDPVNQRPDFVSEIEWQTLKMIAQKNPNPDQELTRLVSNMRFNKQMDVWQSLVKTDGNATDHAQRDALAAQLLADIPAAVTNQAIDKTEAQKAQMTILTDLEHDPHTRQQRMAQEAARIGVKFEIQESP